MISIGECVCAVVWIGLCCLLNFSLAMAVTRVVRRSANTAAGPNASTLFPQYRVWFAIAPAWWYHVAESSEHLPVLSAARHVCTPHLPVDASKNR